MAGPGAIPARAPPLQAPQLRHRRRERQQPRPPAPQVRGGAVPLPARRLDGGPRRRRPRRARPRRPHTRGVPDLRHGRQPPPPRPAPRPPRVRERLAGAHLLHPLLGAGRLRRHPRRDAPRLLRHAAAAAVRRRRPGPVPRPHGALPGATGGISGGSLRGGADELGHLHPARPRARHRGMGGRVRAHPLLPRPAPGRALHRAIHGRGAGRRRCRQRPRC